MTVALINSLGSKPTSTESPTEYSCSQMRRLLNRRNAVTLGAIAGARNLREAAKVPPTYITLDITWACPLSCRDCVDRTSRDGQPVIRTQRCVDPLHPVSKTDRHTQLPIEAVRSTVEFAKAHGLLVQMMGGETLFHPAIDEVLDCFASNRVPCEIVSNGLLVEAHAEPLVKAITTERSTFRVSFNGWHSLGERMGYPGSSEPIRTQILRGLDALVGGLPEHRRGSVFVTIVAFPDALRDLGEIVSHVAKAGVRQVAIIPQRHPIEKTSIGGHEQGRQVVHNLQKQHSGVLITCADDVYSMPTAKPTFSFCPAALLKMIVGADGYLYTCTDHRGSEYARLVHLSDYDWNLEQAWNSEERLRNAFSFSPEFRCCDLDCKRVNALSWLYYLLQDYHIETF